MMRKFVVPVVVAFGFALFLTGIAVSPKRARAQGKNAPDWTTAQANPQRDGWVKTDAEISKDNLQSKKGFGVVRKAKMATSSNPQNWVSQPTLLASASGKNGFKSMGYIIDNAGDVIGFDSDTAQIFWKNPLPGKPNGTETCPGGLTGGVARAATVVTTAAAGRGRGNAGNYPPDFPGRGRSGGLVGEADEGAPNLKYVTATTTAGRGAATPAGAGPGGGAVAGAIPGAPGPPAGAAPAPAAGGGGGGRGRGPGVFTLASDGQLHSLSLQQGFDVFMAPTKFLPPNANVVGITAITIPDQAAAGTANAAGANAAVGGNAAGGNAVAASTSTTVVYAATTNNCGGVPNGVYAINLSSDDKPVASWRSGGSIAGIAGPAFGTDGTLYIGTGKGDSNEGRANSLVALEQKTLNVKDYFSPGTSEFVSTPVVFVHNGKDLIAAANADGKLYLLDAGSLGGSDHKTPLAASAKYASYNGNYTAGALASWQDTDGTRWIVAPAGGVASTTGFATTNGNAAGGGIVAFKVVDQGGTPTLQPGWVSHNITSPLPPIIVKDVVFALSGGSSHAVLYALDATNGKELWNSGTAVASAARSTGGLAAQFGTVWFATADNTLWAFGFPQEKQ